ncbi:MAG: TIGR04282 family arsenosugar biosynthesis glycosyltransferase [Pseudomonadota bacterium]
MSGHQPRIQVFARAPVAGRTKRRLIPALGEVGAADLHATLLRRTVAAVGGVTGADRELWCHPDTGHPLLAACAAEQGLALRVQSGADLGARMAGALEAALAEGAPAAVLVGSDCPGLTAGVLSSALAALEAGADAVLGPAEDGGYYLIGLRRPAPALFQDIPWGGPEVAAATRARATEAGLRMEELPTLRDIDTPADLAAFPDLVDNPRRLS